MGAEAMCVALEEAHAFFLNQDFSSISSMLRHLVPVADVEVAYANEVIDKFRCHLVTGHVLDFEYLQIKNIRYRYSAQTVKFSGILDQIFSQPEFVVAFDPGD